MSKLADKTYECLKEIFGHNIITREYYIKYGNTRLFFDFYIKDVGVVIEVQGRQHDEFVKHFHSNRETFLASKRRDNLKKEYCEKEDLVLVEIREKDEKELDGNFILQRIWSIMIS